MLENIQKNNKGYLVKNKAENTPVVYKVDNKHSRLIELLIKQILKSHWVYIKLKVHFLIAHLTKENNKLSLSKQFKNLMLQ